MESLTKHGKDFDDMLVALDSAIKAKRVDIASYCAYELYFDFRKEMWDVLLNFADGEMKDELEAIIEADELINRTAKKDSRDPLFVAKAVVLLCTDDSKDKHGINPVVEKININVSRNIVLQNSQIPDWVFDCHTIKGKKMGKTDLDMTIDEEEALTPKMKNFFDDCNWFNAYNDDRKRGIISEEEWQKYLKFAEGRSLM